MHGQTKPCCVGNRSSFNQWALIWPANSVTVVLLNFRSIYGSRASWLEIMKPVRLSKITRLIQTVLLIDLSSDRHARSGSFSRVEKLIDWFSGVFMALWRAYDSTTRRITLHHRDKIIKPVWLAKIARLNQTVIVVLVLQLILIKSCFLY